MAATSSQTFTTTHKSRSSKARSCCRKGATNCVNGLTLLFLAAILSVGCEALSSPAASKANRNTNTKSTTSDDTSTNAIQIRLANILDNASERESLQTCRRTAFQPDKQKWLNSERDFVNAQSVLDQKHLCVLAVDTQTNEIIGSADLYNRTNSNNNKGTNTILNVFVRPDQRGRGIGRRLMVDGIEDVLVPLLEEPNAKLLRDDDQNPYENENDSLQQQQQQQQQAVLTLDVYTQNKPAIELYLKLGYEPASAVHAGTLGLARAINANLVVTLTKTVVAPKA